MGLPLLRTRSFLLLVWLRERISIPDGMYPMYYYLKFHTLLSKWLQMLSIYLLLADISGDFPVGRGGITWL